MGGRLSEKELLKIPLQAKEIKWQRDRRDPVVIEYTIAARPSE
jgi:hypothetical protein